MKVPMRWLRDFVDTGLSAKDLAHRLTMAGLEAEKVDMIGDGWQNVFVGHVDAVERHPDADRLVLATVSAGKHHLTVVTGAPNIAAGQIVPLALAGARLIDGHAQRFSSFLFMTEKGARIPFMNMNQPQIGHLELGELQIVDSF